MTQGLGVYIETYGCQMNEYDSELIRSILVEAGHSFTPAEATPTSFFSIHARFARTLTPKFTTACNS